MSDALELGSDITLEEEDVSSPAWVNLYFRRSAPSWRGLFVHPSKEAAEAAANEWVKGGTIIGWLVDTYGNAFPAEDFRFFVALPWREV